MPSTLRIETAEVFSPLLQPARYKGAYGGRASGKSHFFAGLMVEDCAAEPGESGGEGMRAICIREVQKDLTQSAKRLIEDKLREYRLGEADGFKVFKDVIETPGDGVIIFKGMQEYNAESVRSLERFKRAWMEEAHMTSENSLMLLRPTIQRQEGAQIWASWNPRFKTDPIDKLLRGDALPTASLVVRANWRDNPWFPKNSDEERKDCLRMTPEQYEHIWEGDYISVAAGAYFAKELSEAKAQGRIGRVAADPLMTYRAIWDIGGTGAKADAVAIWIEQWIGREIRVLNYYEAQGQPLATHVNWLRDNGYGKALCILPHDGSTNDKVYDVSFESALRQAGFEVKVIPNQGKGAAKMRIEALRRLFPSMWFNEETTKGGRDALGWYHERLDQERGIGLGPDHDWSSHAADAKGLAAVAYEEPTEKRKATQRRMGAGAWMG